MSDIFIDPSGGALSLKVQIFSLQEIGFAITVYASDGKTATEHYSGDSKTANPFIITLKNSPPSYINGYIAGTIKMFDPEGGDNDYNIKVSVVQHQKEILPTITLQGTTIPGVMTLNFIYHIRQSVTE